MDLVGILVKILVIGLVFGLVYAILVKTVIPALPAGFGPFVLAVCGLIAIVIVLGVIFPGALGGLSFGLPLLFFGGVRAVPAGVDPAPRAMLVAVTGTGDGNIQTSPPKTPWQLAFNRLMAGVAIVLPVLLTFIVDPVILYLSKQTVTLPDEYKQWQPLIAIVLTGAVLAYQALRKQAKEAGRQDAANTLVALGVPIGQPLSAADARKVNE